MGSLRRVGGREGGREGGKEGGRCGGWEGGREEVCRAQVYLVARTATWEVLMGSAGPRPFTHCKKFVAATRIRTRDLAAGSFASNHTSY